MVRWWRYLGAKAEDAQAERADPKIQLTQALAEACQPRAAHGTGAIVVAHQKQLRSNWIVWAPSTSARTVRPVRRCDSLITSHARATRRRRPSC